MRTRARVLDNVPIPAAAGPVELLTRQELAAAMKVSVSWLAKAGRELGVPEVHLGPQGVRYRPADVAEWLKTRTTNPTATRPETSGS